MIERVDFVQDPARATSDWLEVLTVVGELEMHLNDPAVAALIADANMPGRSSATVQAIFLQEATRLGFRDESRGLFANYQSSALRPDYFRTVGSTGVILEVERGKTTINNMDLLDFWKCHICEHASYLVLMVPTALRQNETMTPRREFAAVAKRLESFFRPDNYTNVLGLVLLGY